MNMLKAHLLTTGTEITCGEVVNSNASWLALRLEQMGVRVFSHLSVRDQRSEILKALEHLADSDILVLTGGLGPTSDDITRSVVAEWAGAELEFDDQVWRQLNDSYQQRGLPVREAHKHQCYFPKGSERLANPVGTAFGFSLKRGQQRVFILPGPPRELEGMWNQEVLPRLQPILSQSPKQWVRWTCIGVPESEVAELVEPVVKGHQLEVGYRAQVPYVKVKIFVDPQKDAYLIQKVESALGQYVISKGDMDLAVECLSLWKAPVLEIQDEVSGVMLSQRLFEARRALGTSGPELRAVIGSRADMKQGLRLSAEGETFTIELLVQGKPFKETLSLPYKTKLSAERGRRSAAEWAIWFAVRNLRALAAQAKT